MHSYYLFCFSYLLMGSGVDGEWGTVGAWKFVEGVVEIHIFPKFVSFFNIHWQLAWSMSRNGYFK